LTTEKRRPAASFPGMIHRSFATATRRRGGNWRRAWKQSCDARPTLRSARPRSSRQVRRAGRISSCLPRSLWPSKWKTGTGSPRTCEDTSGRQDDAMRSNHTEAHGPLRFWSIHSTSLALACHVTDFDRLA